MLHPCLIHPQSIAVIGGSDNLKSPGGSVLNNLLTHTFKGDLYVVNPKKETVQGVKCTHNVKDLPEVDLAIIAIAAKFTLETVKVLALKKNTKAFIIFSAGFSEKDKEGALIESEIVKIINSVGGSLLGPNNIGLINTHYAGVFTKPIPKLDLKGVDLISGSGATAVFIIEAAMQIGLPFSSIYTVGNSAQIGVEDVLKHMNKTFDPEKDSKIKLLYIEDIKSPKKLLKHAKSLIEKGCKIAAIKSGSTEAGSRAATSHTGAMANSDMAVEALFKKAGIIRCYSRNELIHVAGVLTYPALSGKNMAVVTHAGGPAVMLTDVLAKNNLNIPNIKGAEADKLLEQLYNGSSVSNPIDFLATGTAEQLDTILDYCENKFEHIDAVAVIFGSPGLTDVYDAYDVLDKHIKNANKPIYPILPSVVNVKDEISQFINKGRVVFNDEVLFGSALSKIYNTQKMSPSDFSKNKINSEEIKKIIAHAKDGYLDTKCVKLILDLAGIKTVEESVINSRVALLRATNNLTFPIVMKVVGPVHKTDVNGVVLNVKTKSDLFENFENLMNIPNAEGVLLQPMLKGIELFIGAKNEGKFGTLVFCGMGGILVEILKDVQYNLAPFDENEALDMIKKLKAYPLLQGYRAKKGINLQAFAHFISQISHLVALAPEIAELDINPLIATNNNIVAVDARIKIDKSI